MSRRLNFNENFLTSLDEIISANLDKSGFGVSELAHAMGMSRSNLHRRVSALTNISSSQYLSRYRLEKAMEWLKNSSDTVSEIAYKTGFSSPSYFVKCFHDFYGYPPGEVGNHVQPPNHKTDIRKPEYDRKKIRLITISALLAVSVITVSFIGKKFMPGKIKYQKTMAVLPFIDDSPENDNSYIINGLMEEILDKLEGINDFQVKSRTDSEKFRDSKKSIGEIARELNVNYILEGSGQKIDNQIKLRIQLIEARSGNHILSKTFTEDSENIFELQEKVAFSIASILETKLSRSEKSQIQKLPTANAAAYNLYLQGLEYYRIANVFGNISDHKQTELYHEKGRSFFIQAVKLDPGFADPYLKLSEYFMNLTYHCGNNEHKQMCLDSGYYYAKKALENNLEGDWAYTKLAEYYDKKGMTREADKIRAKYADWGKVEYKKYQGWVSVYGKRNDFYNTIQNYFLYMELKPPHEFPPKYTLDKINYAYQDAGFYEPAKKIIHEKLMLYADTAGFYKDMAVLERHFGNFQKSLEYALKTYKRNSDRADLVMMAKTYQKDYTDAYTYCLEDEKKQLKFHDTLQPGLFNGYVHMKNGNRQEARFNLLGNIKFLREEIDFNMEDAQNFESHFFVFLDYIALGEKEKALRYLKEMKHMKFVPYRIIVTFNYWPGLEELHDDPVFIDVKNTLTLRYRKEHERIEKLLEENGVLYRSPQSLAVTAL